MTIKNQDKNVSAENENILVNASLDKASGILTLYKKNLYNDNTTTSTIDLKGIRLRIKKKTQAEIEALATSTDPNDIEERETHLFLVPFTEHSNNNEGVYKEYIWSKADNQFEILGSTEINLAPLEEDISEIKTLIDYNIDQNSIKAIRLDTIEAILENKVDKITGKGLSTNDYTTEEKNKLAEIEAQANKTIVDSSLSSTSTNPVQNKVINTELEKKIDALFINEVLTQLNSELNS